MSRPARGAAPDDLASTARLFLEESPHRETPFSKRNWGGTLHSLCSYQGKLKPSIAHFLISRFTSPQDRVLDPMSGVGTIPLEARLQGRVGLAGDLSPLAATVSKAKLEPFSAVGLSEKLAELAFRIDRAGEVDEETHRFGLNGPLSNYFHPQTFREIVSAREYFLERRSEGLTSEDAVLQTALLHILHGNRPYALSRRSHPITPFAPSGPTEYRSVRERLESRLAKTVPLLSGLSTRLPSGRAVQGDFRRCAEWTDGMVDAVITSPPFSSSFRFWSTNWMRLWFSGWGPADFKAEPSRYLESEQRQSFLPYGDFAASMANVMRPEGTLILHLGETARENMVQEVQPFLEPYFDTVFVGRESVHDGESHGVRDKGATLAHWYLFARRR